MAQKFDMRFNLHTEHYSPHGAVGFYSRVAIRFLQFIFGLTVIGLYAVDLDRARKAHVYTDSRWAYAVFVGTFSAVAAMIFAIPRAKFYLLWPLDVLIFIFWMALFGVFGKLYINDHPTPEQSGQIRMKHAVWVDFFNALLWLATALYGVLTRLSLGRHAEEEPRAYNEPMSAYVGLAKV